MMQPYLSLDDVTGVTAQDSPRGADERGDGREQEDAPGGGEVAERGTGVGLFWVGHSL